MGKDQELLEAARNGNVPVVEKILNQRAKRSGPLASLRRGPGANVQDSSGYTPLHHAALNGHKEIVRLLLEHEASPNVPDSKGSSPLHLAAWAGHTDIVKYLLTHGPAFTNVNLTTRDNESALHCAAQYGHTAVVAMLLKHGADPTVRSLRDETALDLASQYGRLDTVELLVRTHPELLEPYRSPRGFFPHTPLHRASRNGHKDVVNVLLGAGVSANTRTPAGTALHEAALCGKAEAARALLQGGADLRARDRAGATVLDVLAQFPRHVTHDIVSIINKFRLPNGYDSEGEDLPPIPVADAIGSPYDNVRPGGRPRAQSPHVWERRETEERRVSGTSAISIANVPAPPSRASSLSQTSTIVSLTRPGAPNYMAFLATNCFGGRRKFYSSSDFHDYYGKPSGSTKPGSKPSASSKNAIFHIGNKSNTSTSSTSTIRIGNSKFFRRKQNPRKMEKKDNKAKDKDKNKVNTTAEKIVPLSIISEKSEQDNSDDSVTSSKCVKNSIYHEFTSSGNDFFSEGENSVRTSWGLPWDSSTDMSVTDKVIDSGFNLPGVSGPSAKNVRVVNKVDAKDSFLKDAVSLDDLKRILNRHTDMEESRKITKSKSCTSENIKLKPLVLKTPSTSYSTWFYEGANKKEPSLTERSPKVEDKKTETLYYALLDFSSNPSVPRRPVNTYEDDHVYETYDFKELENQSKPKIDDKVFTPIQVFQDNSTVFIPVEKFSEKAVAKTEIPCIMTETPKNICPDENAVLISSSNESIEDPNILVFRKAVLEHQKPFHMARKETLINVPIMSAISSNRSSLNDGGVSESQSTDSDISSTQWVNTKVEEKQVITNNMKFFLKELLAKRSSSRIVELDSQRTSLSSFADAAHDRASLMSSSTTGSESSYMSMDSIMRLSKEYNQKDPQDNEERSMYEPLATLRQIGTSYDPVYQNITFPRKSLKSATGSGQRLSASIQNNCYHIRGSPNCIHEPIPAEESIYIFNHDSITDTEKQPFIKVQLSPSEINSKGSNICFCKPPPKRQFLSSDNIVSGVATFPRISDKSNEANPLERTAFVCYCENTSCKLHHTKKSKDILSLLQISYSPLSHSVSFPNLNIPESNVTNSPSSLRPVSKLTSEPRQSAFVSVNNLTKQPSNSDFFINVNNDINANSTSSISFYSVSEKTPSPSRAYSSSRDPAFNQSRSSAESENCSSVFFDALSLRSSLLESASMNTPPSSSSESSLTAVPSSPIDVSLSNVGGASSSTLPDLPKPTPLPRGAGLNVALCRSTPSLTAVGVGALSGCSGSDGGHFPYSRSQLMEGSYHSEELSSSYQSNRVREADQLSISSTTSSTGGPSPRERQRCGTNESSVSGGYHPMSLSGYHAQSPSSNNKVSPTPPKKPPRRNLSVSPTHLLPPGVDCRGGGAAPPLARAHQTRSQDDLDDVPGSKHHSGLRHGRSIDQYVDVDTKPSQRSSRPVPQPRPSLALLASGRRDQPVAISTMYENVVIKEQNPRRKLRRNTNNQYENYKPKDINNAGADGDPRSAKYHSSQERSSLESLLDDVGSYQGGTPSDGECRISRSRPTIQTPLSPTHYNQPPTPDHPPPSAKHAEMSIHERMRPLSQEYKRMSRDMETETDPRFLRCSSPSSGTSTDHGVEEYVAEVPFAGLFKGSTTTLDGIGLRPAPAERPKSLRKLKSVYDSGGGRNPPAAQPSLEDPWQYQVAPQTEQSNQTSGSLDKSLSILSPFDEQEEWAKISEIMASFGTRLVRESVFAEELEQEFQARLGLSGASEPPPLPPGPPTTIATWLSSLGLPQLESNFINNGYDDFQFINGVLEENDFAEMAIDEPEKTKLFESSKTLPLRIDEVLSAPPASDGKLCNHNSSSKDDDKEDDPQAVDKWLTSIGLECYQDTFRRHLYADMERVRRIWEVELTAVLEIQKVGHRRRILASVAGRQNGPMEDNIKIDLNNIQKNILNLKAEMKGIPLLETTNIQTTSKSLAAVPPATNLTATSGGETLKRSHKKNRPPPPPVVRGADLEIRAPCELLVGVPGALRTQWRHQPLMLVTSSVMYVANYLGSTVVKELRGTESTQKSIQKLKKSTNEPRALPDIILSISYRGVKFLNTITRDLVCEHEIRNIHCACQDADDLTHFAYITKDTATKSHYCHVFCVATMDQATEVILTLGQAFEVAYQMALRELAPKNNQQQQQQQQQQVNSANQVRSHSSNQIAQQAKTPTHEKHSGALAKDPRASQVHGRSHSVTEIKLNGHQLKVAPMAVSLSNEDFQAGPRNGDSQRSPRTPSAKAPIAVSEDL